MRTQTIKANTKFQEYLTVGAVVTAGGVMFVAGSQDVTGIALQYTRAAALIMTLLGVCLMALSITMLPKSSVSKAPVKSKAAPKKKASGRRK